MGQIRAELTELGKTFAKHEGQDVERELQRQRDHKTVLRGIDKLADKLDKLGKLGAVPAGPTGLANPPTPADIAEAAAEDRAVSVRFVPPTKLPDARTVLQAGGLLGLFLSGVIAVATGGYAAYAGLRAPVPVEVVAPAPEVGP